MKKYILLEDHISRYGKIYNKGTIGKETKAGGAVFGEEDFIFDNLLFDKLELSFLLRDKLIKKI